MKKSHQLINQTSGEEEYYTPCHIISSATACMGGIDLDPASSKRANEFIGATDYFTKEQDGLKQAWFGRVWLNHPFGRVQNPKWISKLLSEWKGMNIEQACCITYACTSEAWFKPLMEFPQCFLVPRTNYLLPNGLIKRGVTKGSVITYLGEDLSRFRAAFQMWGVIKV